MSKFPIRTGKILLLIISLSLSTPSLTAAEGNRSLSDMRLAAVMEAISLTGTPYIYGGTSLRGMDCSGLIYLIYAPLIPGLPRQSTEQYRFGAPVPTGHELPGDLLFFNTEGWTATHVGIYLGEGRFIHAASGSIQQGIVISSLGAPYYRQRYLGARRLFSEKQSEQKEIPR